MSIQMSLVFATLMGQMAILAFLLMPLPHGVRARLVRGYAALRKTANFKVGLIFTLTLMALQFMDCLRKLQKYTRLEDGMVNRAMQAVGLLLEQLASKFYAQRNLYLCGAVLYLGVAIETVLGILDKLVTKEALYRAAQVEDPALVEQIRKKDVEIAAMKKQLDGLQVAYDSLSSPEVRNKDD